MDKRGSIIHRLVIRAQTGARSNSAAAAAAATAAEPEPEPEPEPEQEPEPLFSEEQRTDSATNLAVVVDEMQRALRVVEQPVALCPAHEAIHLALQDQTKSANDLEQDLARQRQRAANWSLNEAVPPPARSPEPYQAHQGHSEWVEGLFQKQAAMLTAASGGEIDLLQTDVVGRMLAMGPTVNVSDTLESSLAILLDKCNLASEAPTICLQLGLVTYHLFCLVERDMFCACSNRSLPTRHAILTTA